MALIPLPPPPPRHPVKRLSQTIGVVVALLLLAMLFGEPAIELNDQRHHPIPGRAVRVNENTVHLFVAGNPTTRPIVVLDGDLGIPAAAWTQVIKELSKSTIVVAWDRPGYGWSPFGSLPHDGVTLMHELHTALRTRDNLGPYVQSQDLPGPYLLVGHGLGAAHMQIFAREYPDEVAGMVLLDAPGEAPDEGLEARRGQLSTETWRRRLMLHRLAAMEAPPWLHALTGADLESSLAMVGRVDQVKAEAAEIAAMGQTLQDAHKLPSLGNKPLLVLTTDHKEDPAFAARVRQGQYLAQLSIEGDHSVVTSQPFYQARNETGQPGPLLQAIFKAMNLP